MSALVNGVDPPRSHTWDFGDGDNGRGRTISHVYQKAGSYSTILTVTDAACPDSYSLTYANHRASTFFNQPSSTGGICLQCLIKSVPTRSPIFIGFPVGLALAIIPVTFVKRRH